MDYKAIEKKWNEIWAQNKVNDFKNDPKKKKYYTLEMFSYPSGANLHLGHWYNYGLTDSHARYKRMKGYDVFQPMGFDSFGLPAENYAIKTGIHPLDSTMKNISTMERQLKEMGAMFDWDAELYTSSPEYYKWTQWLFIQLYKHGLAYQKLSPVNWCPSCNTVIANEQVVDGKCERCGSEVVRKEMTQWFFRITDYAEKLLEGIDKLDWPEKTKTMQKNWIGKSLGGEVEFTLENGESFRVFTTRADTLFGVSYVVLAPEHPLVNKITTEEQKAAVEAYKAEAAKASEIERLSTAKEKTGVFTGAYCVNPINGERVPVWIGDYVLASYGTGAVMGVPSHDARDYVFAQKYGLKITRVVAGSNGEDDALPFCSYGVSVNSGEFSGMKTEDAKNAILEKLASLGKGGKKVNYRIRDWSVSRQRYWGAPIPMIHCPHCGTVPVPEKDLPVSLPYDVKFSPDGKSPLGSCNEFMNVKCPVCGADAKRDPDTLDTFVCSSWYYLRYADSKNAEKAFDKDKIDKMLPVDKYVGGAEHACSHLLYSRFITKALKDMGYIDFDEPFLSLVHQGVILGPDGTRMSKSKGNIINPDKYIAEYGSDIFRLYLMFGFSYTEGGPWNEEGLKSIAKFADRLERAITHAKDYEEKNVDAGSEKELAYALNYAIKNISENLENFSFNTAVARLMELVNVMYKLDGSVSKKSYEDTAKTVIRLIAPMMPHVAEELYHEFGGEGFIMDAEYPIFDPKKLVKDEVELALQINSRVKSKLVVPTSATPKEIEALALSDDKVVALLEGKTPKKVIVIPGRIVNIVV
ncbi:MAG: leucine--tRNA ligase [Firmicutes bacterium]|nr:leucine--tRNA ligase [Bacillota bacterium]MDY5530864.1 leucine--tRNA ligase [Pumilibacteraceae bacterium]